MAPDDFITFVSRLVMDIMRLHSPDGGKTENDVVSNSPVGSAYLELVEANAVAKLAALTSVPNSPTLTGTLAGQLAMQTPKCSEASAVDGVEL